VFRKVREVSGSLEIFKLDFQSEDWDLRTLQPPFMERAAVGSASEQFSPGLVAGGHVERRHIERERETRGQTRERRRKVRERMIK
jgi:hypothetical protein